MERAARGVAIAGLGAAFVDLALLHVLPAPRLHATTGALIPYHPWNFLSEFVRTDYAPLMTACFFLLALTVVATAALLRCRGLPREAALLTVAGGALVLLGFLPTDLADLTTNLVTCGQLTRVEPCTLVGRLHNPLSTFVFAPILLTILLFCHRSRREPEWRGVARFAVVCGALAFCGIFASALYLYDHGWHGAWWTGLMQRSIVFPALLWLAGLLATTRSSSKVTA